MGIEILLGRFCYVKVFFNILLSCKVIWRVGRVGRLGVVVVCGVRFCRWVDLILSFIRRINRFDMVRLRVVDVWRSCFIIFCCLRRRFDFEEVVLLFVFVLFVIVIVGLLLGVCFEIEYVYDYGIGFICWIYFMVV